MNDREITEFRQKLLTLRAELQKLEGSSRDGIDSTDPDQASTGGLSRRDAMQAQIAAGEGDRRRARLIQKIDGALRRIQHGEYGKCFVCEEGLDPAILSADPTITRCANCIEE